MIKNKFWIKVLASIIPAENYRCALFLQHCSLWCCIVKREKKNPGAFCLTATDRYMQYQNKLVSSLSSWKILKMFRFMAKDTNSVNFLYLFLFCSSVHAYRQIYMWTSWCCNWIFFLHFGLFILGYRNVINLKYSLCICVFCDLSELLISFVCGGFFRIFYMEDHVVDTDSCFIFLCGCLYHFWFPNILGNF